MHLVCGKKTLDLSRPRIMGIVNVTPDSFSDGGRHATVSSAVAHAMQLISDGADIIDIGGESTRPGAAPVEIEEEMTRIIPVIRELKGCSAILSVDTRHAEVMQAALDAGADMLNDVHALQAPGAVEVAIGSTAAVCLMHMHGEPETMQQTIYFDDVIQDVYTFLQQRMAVLTEEGMDKERMLIDPGFGFGKTLQHNLQLLKHLDRLADLHVPILVGMSRKTMLGALTGRGVGEREAAGLAANLYALQRGAHIFRVHDVAGLRDGLTVWKALEDTQ
ncbi:MAG: dihydropteroate synthase [Burkholderiales bacterium]